MARTAVALVLAGLAGALPWWDSEGHRRDEWTFDEGHYDVEAMVEALHAHGFFQVGLPGFGNVTVSGPYSDMSVRSQSINFETWEATCCVLINSTKVEPASIAEHPGSHGTLILGSLGISGDLHIPVRGSSESGPAPGHYLMRLNVREDEPGVVTQSIVLHRQ